MLTMDQVREIVKTMLYLLLLIMSSNCLVQTEERTTKSISDVSSPTMTTITVHKDLSDPKYNVCLSEPLRRTDNEQLCRDENFNVIRCVYGACQQETVYFITGGHGTKYHCKCDIGAQGMFCQYRCCRYCGTNGNCLVHHNTNTLNNVTESCECNYRYRGALCEEYRPPPTILKTQEETWYMWVVGVCAGTFLLLIIAAILGPYWMWKHRVILIMKIVHYFQSYEDDDEKQWDAFVSYRADETDESFVLQQIYPKLEEELGFKLCLHFRDFEPGETIANNIINAVEGSRRTILILTPRYIQSEFTRFEYQKAQQEMLKRKHRVIPLMLESITEVSQDLDKNLKGIINAVTYLEWPGMDNEKKLEKFWKRLQLSMPKMKASETSVDSNRRRYDRSASELSGISAQTDETYIPTDSSNDDVFNEDIYMEITPADDNLVDLGDPVSNQIESTCA